MSILSEEKITHLSHLVQNALEKDTGITCKGNRKDILKSIKVTFADAMVMEGTVHHLVKKKLSSYTRKIVEGTADWDILYDKIYREEMKKKGL